MMRERMSRPSSSDPNTCANDGGESRVARLMCAGSCGAIHGANTAQIAKKTTNTTPIAASGLRRVSRGSEMAGADILFGSTTEGLLKNPGGHDFQPCRALDIDCLYGTTVSRALPTRFSTFVPP